MPRSFVPFASTACAVVLSLSVSTAAEGEPSRRQAAIDRANAEHPCPVGTRVRFGRLRGSRQCVRGDRLHGPTLHFHTQGRVAELAHFVNGHRHGHTQLFYWTGKRALEVSYRNGVPWGRWRAWRKSGVRSGVGHYVAGFLHGPVSLFHRNGRPAERGRYRYNKRFGRWTFFHENGRRQLEGSYRDDRRIGVWKRYDAQGKLASELRYSAAGVATR